MTLFHNTLIDAKKAVEKGEVGKAIHILEQHRDDEIKEDQFIKSSLYALKTFLENYINHLNSSIAILSENVLTDDIKVQSISNITKCEENIKAFEEGINELLKREGTILE